MTIDIAKVTKLLEHHFATVTPEQFRANLEEFCPELFAEDEGQSNRCEDMSLSGENYRFGRAEALQTKQAERQLDVPAHSDEIYQQAKQDSKIEIATKLLQKGFSVREVAEMLELDINTIA
jgi:hypothetical protein